MFEELKEDWRIIRANPPGRRFQARFHYRTVDDPPSPLKRSIKLVVGILLIPVGVILWFIPGPGWLTIFIGLGLLAGRSKTISTFLDRVEVIIRAIISRFRPG